MSPLTVSTGPGTVYRVHIAEGLLDVCGSLLADALPHTRRALVVSDGNVWPLYGPRTVESLHGSGFDATWLVLAPGEENKRLTNIERICSEALTAGLDRSSVLVALGGGVVGDMTGLAAALYMRGIAHAQLPTTLLAMVDSSVGGKTAVDLPGGKNIVGVFHQPALVAADTEALATLPLRELAAGAAEIVKAALLGDAGLFAELESGGGTPAAGRAASLTAAIGRAVEVKRRIVEADERESGQRALLNLGHTFGHALETLNGYRGILHGEAVAIGISVACRLAVRLGEFSNEDASRVQRLLTALDLPVTLGDVDRRELLLVMRRDKKSRDGRLRLVLPTAIGSARIAAEVPEREVMACLEESP